MTNIKIKNKNNKKKEKKKKIKRDVDQREDKWEIEREQKYELVNF